MADQNNKIKTEVEFDSKKAEKNIDNLGKTTSKSMEKSANSTKKQSSAFKEASGSVDELDKSSGGLIGTFKKLATTPLGVVILLVAGAFKAISLAIGRSEEASQSFAKIGAKLEGFFNGFIAVIIPVVEALGETLVFAIEKPGEAWDSLVDTLDSGWQFIKKQVVDRFSAGWTILSGNVRSGILKMRIAWNEFTGDSEEAKMLQKELNQIGKDVKEAALKIKQADEAIKEAFNDAVNAVVEFGDKAVENYDKAAEASEKLAGAERQLVKNRIALEKRQLKSLRLAEEERQARDDTSKSISERIAANTRLGKVLEDQAKTELSIAQQNLNLALLEKKATGESIENIEAVGDAELKILEIRERITGQRSEQLTNENALLEEQRVKLDEIRKREIDAQNELDQIAIERQKSLNEDTLQQELDFLEKKRMQELENDELLGAEKFEIEQRFRLQKEQLINESVQKEVEAESLKKDLLLEIEELQIERLRETDQLTLERELEFLEKKRMQDVTAVGLTEEEILLINTEAEMAKRKLIEDTKIAKMAQEAAVLDAAINGAAEAFGIQQELAVAQMIMAAPEAISGSFKEAAKAYKPPISLLMGALGAAGTVAPIVKGLSDIKKVRFSKSKGGSKGGSINSNSSSSSSANPDVINNIASNEAANLGIDSNLGSSAGNDASNNVLGSNNGNVIFSESNYNDFQNQVQFVEQQVTIT